MLEQQLDDPLRILHPALGPGRRVKWKSVPNKGAEAEEGFAADWPTKAWYVRRGNHGVAGHFSTLKLNEPFPG